MDQLQRIEEGIRRADAAGDSEGVKILGAEYRRLKAAPPAQAGQPQQPPQTLFNNSFTTGLKEGAEPMGQLVGGMGDVIGAGMRAVGIPTRDTSKPVQFPTHPQSDYVTPNKPGNYATLPGALMLPGTVKDDSYQPQEFSGRVGRALGSFAAGGVAGPESAAGRVLSVALPAIASETAGELPLGEQGKKYARLGGALVGGLGVGAASHGATSLARALEMGAPATEKSAVDAVAPTVAEWHDIASANYGALKDPAKNPIITKDILGTLRDKVKTFLADNEFHPDDETGTAKLWARIDALPDDNITLKGLEGIRQYANKVGRNFTTSDGFMANKVKGIISDFMGDLDESHIIGTEASGPMRLGGAGADTAGATNIPGLTELKTARNAYKTMKKAQVIQSIVDNADIRGAANYTQAGADQALRRGFASLATNPKRFAQFTPDEQDAIRLVAKGGPMQNVLRGLGKMAIRGPVSAGATTVIGHLMGPAGPYMLAAAGEAAKAGSASATENNVSALAALVRGGPEAVAKLSTAKRKALINSLQNFAPAALAATPPLALAEQQ